MLQKGFLKPKEDSENTRTIKNSRIFLFSGVFAVLFAFIYMTIHLRQVDTQESLRSSVMISGIIMIIGIVLVLTSMWMNFFLKNKNQKKL